LLLALMLVSGASLIGYQIIRPAAIQADPDNPKQVMRGQQVYGQHCAICHGRELEGQPDWRLRLPNGRLPAPPHDGSGHTWHHSDATLFGITRQGLVPPYAPADYESDMPGFAGRLTDADIWAVLAFIKSRWPEEQRRFQQDITARAQGEAR